MAIRNILRIIKLIQGFHQAVGFGLASGAIEIQIWIAFCLKIDGGLFAS